MEVKPSMAGKEGIYNQTAVKRILHLQKLEYVMDFFLDAKLKIGNSKKLKKKAHIIDNALEILQKHHKQAMNSPSFYKKLSKDVKKKERI